MNYAGFYPSNQSPIVQIETTTTEPQTEPTKKCVHCGRELPHSHFSHNSKAKDGLQTWCKECRSESAKESYRRQKQQKSTRAIINPFTAMTAREQIEQLRMVLVALGENGYHLQADGKLHHDHTVEIF